ncbi:MAG: hypothetical protein AAF612_04355 [Planctomycetota bacterium]
MLRLFPLAAALCLVADVTWAQAPAEAQPDRSKPLTLGQPFAAQFVGGQRHHRYTFEIEEPGLLMASVDATRGSGDFDLQVHRVGAGVLPQGQSNFDVGGMPTSERVALHVREPGGYAIDIRDADEERVGYEVVAVFVPMPIAIPQDPDGDAGSPPALEAGAAIRGRLDATGGDRFDWYALPAADAGHLTVTSRSGGADLILAAYRVGDLSYDIAYSDQDLRGELGHEALMISLDEDTRYVLRVSSYDDEAHYTIQVEHAPVREPGEGLLRVTETGEAP